MATIDLSRSSTDFRKHYTSVRAQQGRVFVDDDHNENERLHVEAERRSRVDIIGPAGSPDDGFRISNPKITANKIDFDINTGTFYLGGLRLDMDKVETLQLQTDWLQFSGSNLPSPPGNGKRLDLVYLEAWLQTVSAVEDNELFEVALSGPDTSTRMRLMRRVHVATGRQTTDCHKEWKDIISDWALNNLGTLNGQNELACDTKLKIDFEPGTNPSDLCSPPVAGGYLGAENQAVRVELVDSTHFTWGFDNAAPLYRVKVSTNGAGQMRVINMLNEPKDQAHWPLSGQTVELLPWSAVLPNNEKLAETRGFLAQIDSSYDPDGKQFTITANVPANFGNGWKARSDAAQLGEEFFYLRVWNRGSDTTSSPTVAFITGTAVSLGHTGLTITITGNDRRPGDYWIIAARPESPNRVVPWLLETGRGPHGYRRFFTPLAVIEWDGSGAVVTGKIAHDCRDTFPPLTRMRNCCTYTVGNGETSFGAFNNIQDAIDQLPAEGGEICILPGVYQQSFKIVDRDNIIIHGCGSHTIIEAPSGGISPLIYIEDSQRIKIKSLTIEAPHVIGIRMVNSITAEPSRVLLEHIHIEDIEILARDYSAIDCRGGQFITVINNTIRHAPLLQTLSSKSNAGKSPAIFVRADDVRIELNRIECVITRRSISAMGGLQIGGGSERVEIRRNQIVGGNGNGITLGSFTYILEANVVWLSTDYIKAFTGSMESYLGAFLFIGDDDCPHPEPDPKDPTDPDGNPLVPISDGNLIDIRILENEILDMGLNGITTLRFSRRAGGFPILITDIAIESNRVRRCVQIDLGDNPFNPLFPYGFGGVAITASEYLTLRNNWIETNGRSFIDPVCGVFLFFASGVVIEQNQIKDNGPLIPAQRPPTPGPRGGIFIRLATTPLMEVKGSDATGSNTEVKREGFPAVRITDNIVISPFGTALLVNAQGDVFVESNQLVTCRIDNSDAQSSAANAFNLIEPIGGKAVKIFNGGVTFDLAAQFTNFTGFAKANPGENINQGLRGEGSLNAQPAPTATGNILFNDNRVMLAPDVATDDEIDTSITLMSGDDISMQDNQCDCRLNGQILAVHALVIGYSIRVAGNRFKEPLDVNGFAAYTIAMMNSTTDNLGTCCFLIAGTDAVSIKGPNRSLMDLSGSDFCQERARSFANAFAGTNFKI
ncbi:MAG: DUF6519 domain-containing protein [Blastocatellia bacterium]